MSLAGALRGRKRRRTTVPDPTAEARPDLVRRNFAATAPNRLWVADFTYSAQPAVMCSSVGGPRSAR